MALIRRIAMWLRAVFRHSRVESEMDKEMRHHLQLETEAQIRLGMSPGEARRAALINFGGMERAREEVRDQRGTRWLEQTIRDLRSAARSSARTPVFALTAILSVGIGVGAVTAIATLGSTLLLLPPAGVGSPERVVSVGRTSEDTRFDNMSYPVFLDYEAGATALSGLAAVPLTPQNVGLSGPEGGEPIRASTVSANFFQVLQARPALGQFFSDEPSVSSGIPVVVLKHSFWRDRFNSDPSVIGRGITLNGHPFTIVGVAEEAFQGPFVVAPSVWVPISTGPLLGIDDAALRDRQNGWLLAVGRLAQGASLTEAQAELSTIAARLAAEYPNQNRGHDVRLTPLSLFPGGSPEVVARFITLLATVAGLLLLIAATNVAGLLLARVTARSPLGWQSARLGGSWSVNWSRKAYSSSPSRAFVDWLLRK